MPVQCRPYSILKICYEQPRTILRKVILEIRKSKYGDGPGSLFHSLSITPSWAARIFTEVFFILGSCKWAPVSCAQCITFSIQLMFHYQEEQWGLWPKSCVTLITVKQRHPLNCTQFRSYLSELETFTFTLQINYIFFSD